MAGVQARSAGADGASTRHRITWTPNPDGSVRQFWESTDASGQWTVAFDGVYRKQAPWLTIAPVPTPV